MVAENFPAAIGCVFSGATRRIYGVDATPSDSVLEAQRLAKDSFWRIAPVDTGKGDL
jgi:hypothetical protein